MSHGHAFALEPGPQAGLIQSMALPKTSAPKQLSAIMTRIYDKGLTTPSGGNLSVLDDDGSLWVTPSLLDKGRLAPEMMVKIAADGTWSGPIKPTSEWFFHRAVLQARPDCRACAHAHCTSLAAFSIVGKRLPLDQFPDLCRWLNQVVVAPYAHPGSRALGDTLAATFASGCDAALMEKHGAVTCGHDLHQAFCRLDVIEHLAKIRLAATRLGALRPLDTSQLQDASRRMATRWDDMTVDPSSQTEARARLIETIHRAHHRDLLCAQGGSFSCRHGTGFLIEPDGADHGTLTAADLVYVEGNRCETGKLPDTTAPIHQALYQAHTHVNAIATALPPSLMAFAATDVAFDTRMMTEATMMLKTVPRLPFSARFAPSPLVESLSAKTSLALIENACLVATGDSPFTVLDRLEVAEFTAHSILNATLIGSPRPMTAEELAGL
jgi:L-fuculose-phosphate aldolase